MAAMAHTEVEDRAVTTPHKKMIDQRPKLIKTTGVHRVNANLSRTDHVLIAMDQSTMMAPKASP